MTMMTTRMIIKQMSTIRAMVERTRINTVRIVMTRPTIINMIETSTV